MDSCGNARQRLISKNCISKFILEAVRDETLYMNDDTLYLTLSRHLTMINDPMSYECHTLSFLRIAKNFRSLQERKCKNILIIIYVYL